MLYVLKSLRNFLFDPARDQSGSISTFIAAAIVPLLAFGGLSVDTARGYLMKTRLNYALDAAALAGGRVMFDVAERDAAIESFFKANFPDNFMGATITGPTPTIDVNNQTLKLDASASLGTSLMRVLGIDDMQVAASSEVQRQIRGMELAMVLDITGSMRHTAPGSSQNKLEDLRDAAENLVEILYAGRDEIPDFYMSVVPYTATVNVGNQHSDWLLLAGDPPPTDFNPATDLDSVDGYAASDYSPTAWKGCVEARHTTDRDLNDDPPSSQKFYPHYWPSDIGWETSKYDTLRNRNWRGNPWNTGNIDEQNGDYGLGPNLNCGNPIQPLVRSRSTVDATLANLQHWRFGGTMGNFGLAWGWRTISPRWRGLWDGDDSADAPKDYVAELLANDEPLSDKAVVMMTDGQNNIVWKDNHEHNGNYSAYGKPEWNRLGTMYDSPIRDEISGRMLDTCDLMKAEGIIIYTITFDTEGTYNEDIRDTYEACATTPNHYFNSPGEEQLTAAFIAIGTQLSNLRLAK